MEQYPQPVRPLGWFEGLAKIGCTFVELIPNEKRPKRSFDHYSHQVGQTGVSSAMAWLARGSNVGIVPAFPLWTLDADDHDQVERTVDRLADLGIDPLVVATRRGGHFYFRFPADFPADCLKTYLPAGNDKHGNKVALDFKLPGTLLVAPGSAKDGITYRPASSWRLPPILDPRAILPDGKFWKEPQRPFLVNTRPLKDRLAAARVYLKGPAPVSVHLKRGAGALAGVASHLVVFLGLDPVTAASLLAHGPHSWNSRCMYQDGTPFPWTKDELWTACNAAVGTVPAAGVKAYERNQASRAFRERLAGMVATVKSSLTRPDHERVKVERVRRSLGWLGVVDWEAPGAAELTGKMLGAELGKQGVKERLSGHARLQTIPGLDYNRMVGAILTTKRAAMALEGVLAVCPLLGGEGSLIKQRSSLPPPPLGVEKILSDNSTPLNRTTPVFEVAV